MIIMGIKVLRGPNYWSNYRKQLIELKIDLKKYEKLPSNLLEGFTSRLMNLIPSLYKHFCSLDKEGGFLERLKEGTWLSHVIEHVAIELQYLAGMNCGFGRTRGTHIKGVYNIVFSYEIEDAGIYAAKAAVRIVSALAENKPYNFLNKDINRLKKIVYEKGFGISTKSILAEAKLRNIPITALDNDRLIMLGYGCNQKIISGALSSQTSCLGADIASDKHQTKKILKDAYIRVPKGQIINNLKKMKEIIKETGFPLVIKPLNGNHGKGVTTNINSQDKALRAYKIAKSYTSNIVIEEFIKGFDFRFLVVNFKVTAVAKRIAASIIGDGKSTINELIENINKDPKRGNDHENILTTIEVDKKTLILLEENGFNLESILNKGQQVFLKDAANLSAGGTAIDVTESIHPYNILLAERIARLMNLDICGIDLVTERIDIPLNENNGAVIEVNAAPGLRMHLYSSGGKSRNVAKDIIDMLFPESKNSRIPIVAVTGTNGKTATVRLIADLANNAGFRVGFTCTDGITINNTAIFRGDCTGPKSAQAVLRDPLVNFAVLECARGGILREGLGFDKCDISILTNISEDHLGIGGIETLEELARLKSVVPYSTHKEGYSILNADDNLVYKLKENLNCHIALFSMYEDNQRIKQHCEDKGLAAYIENNYLIVKKGDDKTSLVDITQIPITFYGSSKCMIQNILPTVLAGVISQIKLQDIAQWLKSLVPSPEQIPGRMNLFNFGNLKVLLDYAHNVGAILELREYLKQIKSNKKVGVIGVPGDRRDMDIRNIGFNFAEIFDEIIIRHDIDGRGRSNAEISALLIEGIKQNKSNPKVEIISDEQTALEYVLNNSVNGDFIVYCPEDINKAITYLNKLESQYKEKLIERNAYDAQG